MNAVPDPDVTLTELAALGLRAARVVTRMMEIEQASADVVAGWLPTPGLEIQSLTEAAIAGRAVDGVSEAMAQGVPRVEILARAFDRLARSVRRSAALTRRIQAGWPRAAADDRAAMVRRHVVRAVSDTIRREAAGEAAERLFDDLAERMDDPTLQDEILSWPVDQVIRRVCQDLGLVAQGLAPLADQPAGPRPPPHADTG